MTGSAILMWDTSGLCIAVPKKRGHGYLKVPYGHHAVARLNRIATAEGVDMDGLDGYLNLGYGYTDTDERAAIVHRVLPQIAAHYGFASWREDPAAFWGAVQGSQQNDALRHPGSTPQDANEK